MCTIRLYPFLTASYAIILRRLSSLLSLVTAELDLVVLLDGALWTTNSRHTLNGVAAEISTVAWASSLVGDSLVAPIYCALASLLWFKESSCSNYVLACSLVTAQGGLSETLGGLVGVLGRLADDSNTSLCVGDNTDRLNNKSSLVF